MPVTDKSDAGTHDDWIWHERLTAFVYLGPNTAGSGRFTLQLDHIYGQTNPKGPSETGEGELSPED